MGFSLQIIVDLINLAFRIAGFPIIAAVAPGYEDGALGIPSWRLQKAYIFANGIQRLVSENPEQDELHGAQGQQRQEGVDAAELEERGGREEIRARKEAQMSFDASGWAKRGGGKAGHGAQRGQEVATCGTAPSRAKKRRLDDEDNPSEGISRETTSTSRKGKGKGKGASNRARFHAPGTSAQTRNQTKSRAEVDAEYYGLASTLGLGGDNCRSATIPQSLDHIMETVDTDLSFLTLEPMEWNHSVAVSQGASGSGVKGRNTRRIFRHH